MSAAIESSPPLTIYGLSLKTALAVAAMTTLRRSARWMLLWRTAISPSPGLSLSAGCWVRASSVGHMPVPDTARTGPEDALHRGLTDDLRLAHLLADDADSITMSRFKSLDLHVTSKPDLTPVSDADTAAAKAIRRTLSRARPRDAVHGEEMGDTGWGPRRWVIDPIDGTKNFVRGVPVWATLIALVDEGMPVVGLVSAPALGRRWWAAPRLRRLLVLHARRRGRCRHRGRAGSPGRRHGGAGARRHRDRWAVHIPR